MSTDVTDGAQATLGTEALSRADWKFESISLQGRVRNEPANGRGAASGAKYMTSVRTGAFVLGAAGLLRDRQATTYWASTDLLHLVGATHERSRVLQAALNQPV